MMLEKSPTPLYFQLKNIIKSKILSNEYKGQERLPSETEICSDYGISRATARQAFSELEKEGLIYRIQGRGTFVNDRAGLKNLALTGSIENLLSAGKGTRHRTIDYKETSPPPHIEKIFKLQDGENVFLLELLRFIPKGAFGYSFVYLPPQLGKLVYRDEITESQEIITFLEDKLKNRVHRASQTIKAAFAYGTVAKHISVKPKSPLLLIEREYYARNGAIMFLSINYFRSDLYKYRVELI